VDESDEIWEQLEPAEAVASPVVAPRRPQFSAGQSGKYLCLRCGWRWSPRRGSPDPPNACARCRTAYWSSPPHSARANRPDDPRWKAERDILAGRRRARHFARLKELTHELGSDTQQLVKPALPPPQSNELPLRGDELAKIVLADVADILAQALSRDRIHPAKLSRAAGPAHRQPRARGPAAAGASDSRPLSWSHLLARTPAPSFANSWQFLAKSVAKFASPALKMVSEGVGRRPRKVTNLPGGQRKGVRRCWRIHVLATQTNNYPLVWRRSRALSTLHAPPGKRYLIPLDKRWVSFGHRTADVVIARQAKWSQR
jgi:hypothetical protein